MDQNNSFNKLHFGWKIKKGQLPVIWLLQVGPNPTHLNAGQENLARDRLVNYVGHMQVKSGQVGGSN